MERVNFRKCKTQNAARLVKKYMYIEKNTRTKNKFCIK